VGDKDKKEVVCTKISKEIYFAFYVQYCKSCPTISTQAPRERGDVAPTHLDLGTRRG
jgi:hypothetical protein